MKQFYDLSHIKMPEGTVALETIISNEKVKGYELAISLFDKCQLNCDFCFQSHTKHPDIETIRKIPYDIIKQDIIDDIVQSEAKFVYVRLWGGELFHNGIPDEMFDVYKELCDNLRKVLIERLPYLTVEFSYMSNGVWDRHREKVKDLLKYTGGTIGFSYDPVGRFKTPNAKQMMIDNAKYFYDFQGHLNLAMTSTKRNIETILNGEDEFFKNYPKEYSLEVNSYIPGADYKINLPDDELMWKLWKYMIDNDMFNCKILYQYIDPVIHPHNKVWSSCSCQCSTQYSYGKLIKECVSRTSQLPLNRFYGHHCDKLTRENCQAVKTFLGTMKRGCLQCENKERCSWFCCSSILFDEYKCTCCPINRLINYVEEHKDDIKKRFDTFNERYDINKIFNSYYN